VASAVPDPLAKALELTAAQRVFVEQAAELAGRFPGSSVEWTRAGFRAKARGEWLGPVSCVAALESLLNARRWRR
jgi:hypothetical protein